MQVWALVVTGLLAVAMGLQAAAARRLAVKDVTTVVVTSTLTGLAADSRLAGGTGDGWARRSLAVGLILVGAAVGALLLRAGGERGVGVGMLVAGVLALVTVGAGAPAPRGLSGPHARAGSGRSVRPVPGRLIAPCSTIASPRSHTVRATPATVAPS